MSVRLANVYTESKDPYTLHRCMHRRIDLPNAPEQKYYLERFMMSCWFHLAAVGILTQALATAQQPGNNPPDTLRFDTGIIANGSYTNECLGILFPIPDGWDLSKSGVAEGKAIHSPDGSLALLMLDRHTEHHFGNRIVLTAFDTKGSTMNAQDFVTSAVQAQINAKPEGRQLIRDTFAVDYAGNHFFRSDYKQSLSDGNALYLAFVDTKFRGYFIGAILIAGAPGELEKSADSLRGILFQEDHPNPKCVAGEDNTSPRLITGIVGSDPPPQLDPGSGNVRVSQAVMQSLLIKKVHAEYPPLARQARIQGTVVLNVLINNNGDIEHLTVFSGHPMLVPAAVEAVKHWKYKPYFLNGQPMKVETTILVDFSLN